MWAEGLRTSGSQLGGGGAVRILCGSFTTHTRAKIRDKGEMCTLKKVLQVRAIRLQIGVQRAGQMGPTEVLCLARGVLKVFEFEQLQGTRAALYRPHRALSPTCVTCLAPGSCNPYTRRSIYSDCLFSCWVKFGNLCLPRNLSISPRLSDLLVWSYLWYYLINISSVFWLKYLVLSFIPAFDNLSLVSYFLSLGLSI